jgi:uncharacterized membrane protein YraQ (UPF0718 family)
MNQEDLTVNKVVLQEQQSKSQVSAKPQQQSLLRRYSVFIFLSFVYVAAMVFAPEIGSRAISLTWDNVVEMLLVVPPIFVLLGLLDVWVPREIMIKLTGPGSGVKGIIISLMLGSFAAGPLYAAFPVAGIMLKKGTRFSNIMIFIGAWSTTKIPLLLFEAGSLGTQFMLLRFALNIPVIFILGWLVEKSLSAEEKKSIYANAENDN